MSSDSFALNTQAPFYGGLYPNIKSEEIPCPPIKGSLPRSSGALPGQQETISALFSTLLVDMNPGQSSDRLLLTFPQIIDLCQ